MSDKHETRTDQSPLPTDRGEIYWPALIMTFALVLAIVIIQVNF